MEEKKAVEPKRSFASMKEGQVIVYTMKGQRFKTRVSGIKTAQGLSFKTEDGKVVSMTSEDTKGTTYKDSSNVLWELV